MLSQLTIQNFAITAYADIELAPGMTAITGETGAGKSIMLDALGYALGNRADSAVVKAGTERAEICAIFDISQVPDAGKWLKSQELQDGDEVSVRRIITAEGRSRGYINGQTVPLQQLKELGKYLLDLHSQHEHQFLMRSENHRKILDNFAGHQSLVAEVTQSYQQWHKCKKELQKLQSQEDDIQSKSQLLQYQLNELDHLGLQENELIELEQEQKRLSNGEILLNSLNHATRLLDGEDSEQGANQLVQQVLNLLEELSEPSLKDTTENLESARILLEESLDGICRFQNSFELDEARLAEVDERLGVIYDLSRKHKVKPENLYSTWNQLKQELNGLNSSQNSMEELEHNLEKLESRHLSLCQKLTSSRQKAIKRLDKLVSEQMQILSLKGAGLQTKLSNFEDGRFSAYGMEDVEFYIQTNPGQPAQPLSKSASGGELSRISLAIQVISAESSDIPTLVFDEVDVGISGGTAEIVGRLLRHLGKKGQVLCVTHQPQVASQAHQHLKVEKSQTKKDTHVQVSSLAESHRVEEIARMLGGVTITDQTLAHAQEMVSLGQMEH